MSDETKDPADTTPPATDPGVQTDAVMMEHDGTKHPTDDPVVDPNGGGAQTDAVMMEHDHTGTGDGNDVP